MIGRFVGMALLAAGMAACAPMAEPGSDAGPVLDPAADGACNADPVQHLVGQPASQSLGADAVSRSGARTLRWIPEGSAVTMDFRQDRLNIDLDRENKVARIHCG